MARAKAEKQNEPKTENESKEPGKQATKSRADLAALMKKFDMCTMTTVAEDGSLWSRPMSNNRRVEWDGDSWFFAYDDSSQVQQIQRNPSVNLAYARPRRITFITLVGKGEIVRDEAKKKELWSRGLKFWFPQGPSDPRIVLIKVKAAHASYWGMDGEAQLSL